MENRYDILFNLALQHEYFIDGQCADFEIIPAEDCLAKFKNLGILFRYTENGCIALVSQKDQYKLLTNIASGKADQNRNDKAAFRFYLKLRNPLYLNYTNVGSVYGKSNKFYFSNRAKNKYNSDLYLSASISPFDGGKQYLPGNMATDPQTGQTYECLTKYNSKKKTELSSTNLWTAKVWQYASDSDIITCSSGNYTVNLSKPAKKAEVSILGFNYVSQAFDLQVIKREMAFSSLTANVPVDLTSLSPGRYSIRINDESNIIYYDPVANATNIFGIIEIFDSLPGKDDYSLITADNNLKNVTYKICFPVRRVLWKYIRKDGKAESITDTGNNGYKFKLTGDEFISSTPIPFSQDTLRTLKLEFNTTDFQLFPLPNPPVERLKTCRQNDYDYFCSEVNLRY